MSNNQSFIIQPCDAYSDCHSVAKLHVDNMSKGFLRELGHLPLFFLYFAISKCRYSQLMIAKDKHKSVIGFVAFAIDISKFYKYFFFRFGIIVAIVAVPKLFKIERIKKVINLFFYGKKKPVNKILAIKSELLSIVVEPNWRGKKVSDELFKKVVHLSEKMKPNNCFKIIVGEQLTSAQKFYEKMGAEKVCEINVHHGNKSLVYVKYGN